MKTFALIAAAGLASVASAQSVSVNLTHDDADGQINVGESVTWTLSVSFTGFAAGATASGGNMSLSGNNAVGTASNMTYGPANGGNNGGTASGAGFAFINWTDSLFLEAFGAPPAQKSSPYTVGTFTFTATGEGTVDYSIGLGTAVSAFVSIDTSAFATTNYATPGDVAINIDSLTVVPSPASAGLLGLGGLVATRRRRA